LAFIENNFLGAGAIGTIGPPQYPFADAFAPDRVNLNIPLSGWSWISRGIFMGRPSKGAASTAA